MHCASQQQSDVHAFFFGQLIDLALEIFIVLCVGLECLQLLISFRDITLQRLGAILPFRVPSPCWHSPPSHPSLSRYPNKLKGVFLTDSPNKVWVSDITYVKIDGAFVYLCVVIDLYSRKVIAHKVSNNIDTALVKNTFMSAFESRGYPEGVTFHSDQGTQYTSYAFRTLLRSKGVVLSYSRPGTPHDNAVAESFFASIKKEDFRRTFYPTKADVIKAVNEYVEFYNDYRPQQRLGYLTPNKVEYNYYKNLSSQNKTMATPE